MKHFFLFLFILSTCFIKPAAAEDDYSSAPEESYTEAPLENEKVDDFYKTLIEAAEGPLLEHGLCFECHQMKKLAQEYTESPHYTNASGVKTTCGDCHIGEGIIGTIKAKLKGSYELYLHIRGYGEKNNMSAFERALIFFDRLLSYDEKKLFAGEGTLSEEAREELRAEVLTKMVLSNSKRCLKFHNWNTMDLSKQNVYARKKHAEAKKLRRELINFVRETIAKFKEERDQIPPDERKNRLLEFLSGDIENRLYELLSEKIDVVREDTLKFLDATDEEIILLILAGRLAAGYVPYDVPESQKITCIDCHAFPAHKKPEEANEQKTKN